MRHAFPVIAQRRINARLCNEDIPLPRRFTSLVWSPVCGQRC